PFLLLMTQVVKSQSNQTVMFTKAEILSDLDSLQAFKALPFFGLETQAFVVCRVHLYSDSTRWAIVLEELKPSPGGGDITLYFFGNCLVNQERHGLSWFTKQFPKK